MASPASEKTPEQRQIERYQALLRLNDVISRHCDLKELFGHIATCLRSILSFDLIAVGLHDKQSDMMRLTLLDAKPRAQNKAVVDVGFTVSPDAVPSRLVMETQKPVVVRPDDDLPYPIHKERMQLAGAKVSYHFPLTTSFTRMGELIMGSLEDVELDAEEMDFMQRVANQVAVAIENSLNYDQSLRAQRELEHRNAQRDLLLELTNNVVSMLDLQEVLRAAAIGIRRVVPCDVAVVSVPDGDGKNLVMRAIDIHESRGFFEEGVRVPIDASMAGKCFKKGGPIVVNQVDPNNYSAEMYRKVAGEGLQSQCFIPFVNRGRTLGVLGIARREQKRFDEDEVEFLGLVSTQVSIALANALAFGEISALKEKLAQEKFYLEEEIREGVNFEEIIGESPALREALLQVQTVAPSDATVLILGETGTGKELIARALHQASRRKDRTFIKLNCAAIPTGLLESELFGHEKGAFTGAIAQKIGRLELAHAGTLFLDEVGDIPLELQPKLLRALQEREYERLGSAHTRKADFRLLAATNRDLGAMVAEKQFRSDLFYRLNVFPITIPPLRQRQDDIPRLVRYFVSRYAKKMDKRIESVPAKTMAALQRWNWPGNVRELENFIERSVILTQGAELRVPTAELAAVDVSPPAEALRDNERDHILKVLREARGTLAGPTGAAARLGLKRTTLQSKMKKLGITRAMY